MAISIVVIAAIFIFLAVIACFVIFRGRNSRKGGCEWCPYREQCSEDYEESKSNANDG